MQYLNWELDVLSRVVSFKNVSTAAQHIGLSQPQISRIIAKLESTYDINLLDRDCKRKSVWTPAALKLAKLYLKTHRNFWDQARCFSDQVVPERISIGSLEGLSQVGLDFCKYCFENFPIHTIDFDVYDLSDLESLFLKGEVQIIFTSRTPGRKKYSNVKLLGYQSLTFTKTKGPFQIMSAFDYATCKNKDSKKQTIISNSLAIRKIWAKEHGGAALVPSEVYKKRKNSVDEVEALLLGDERLTSKFWKKLIHFNEI